MFDASLIIFFLILSLVGSIINGGLGYGYSSFSIPLAILVLINRIVNPAYVLLEAILNTVMLGLSGKKNILATTKRVAPIMLALVPGVIGGSYLLSIVAPLWVRLIVYAVLLPLIFMQAAGLRRPIKNESIAGLPLGAGVGLLYSITTISGPPIALFWNNQGLAKGEFRAALAQIRIAESYLTCASYYLLGLFSLTSLQLFGIIAPPILVGLPIGMFIVRKVAVDTFRRICMNFDGAIVGYGLSQVFITLFAATLVEAYGFWAIVLSLNLILLYRFFKNKAAKRIVAEAPASSTESPPFTRSGSSSS